MSEKSGKEVEEAYKQIEAQMKARKTKGISGKIVSVKLGALKDFIPVQKLHNPERADKQAICVEISTPDGYTIKKALVLSAHPNSSLIKFWDRYQSWPRINLEVRLRYDETSGFWRLDL